MNVTKITPSIFERDKGDKRIYLEKTQILLLFLIYTFVTFVTFKDTGCNVCHIHLSHSGHLCHICHIQIPRLSEFFGTFFFVISVKF